MNPTQMLRQGCEEMGLNLPAATVGKLMDYLALMEKWNKVYNLTAIRSIEEKVSNHLLDSLSILPYVQADDCVDVGSGAGLPGIVLALAKPECRVTLVESNSKKTAFQQQAKISLGLDNLTVVNSRAESWIPEKKSTLVVSRAFSSLADFAGVCRHFCDEDGYLYAMKGLHPGREIGQLPAWVAVEKVIELKVPGLLAERHLVVMKLINL